jgi:hypothetical protein
LACFCVACRRTDFGDLSPILEPLSRLSLFPELGRKHGGIETTSAETPLKAGKSVGRRNRHSTRNAPVVPRRVAPRCTAEGRRADSRPRRNPGNGARARAVADGSGSRMRRFAWTPPSSRIPHPRHGRSRVPSRVRFRLTLPLAHGRPKAGANLQPQGPFASLPVRHRVIERSLQFADSPPQRPPQARQSRKEMLPHSSLTQATSRPSGVSAAEHEGTPPSIANPRVGGPVRFLLSESAPSTRGWGRPLDRNRAAGL